MGAFNAPTNFYGGGAGMQQTPDDMAQALARHQQMQANQFNPVTAQRTEAMGAAPPVAPGNPLYSTSAHDVQRREQEALKQRMAGGPDADALANARGATDRVGSQANEGVFNVGLTSNQTNDVQRQKDLRGSSEYQDYLKTALARQAARLQGATPEQLGDMPSLSTGARPGGGIDEEKFAAYQQRLRDRTGEGRNIRLANNPNYLAGQQNNMLVTAMKDPNSEDAADFRRKVMGLADRPVLDPNVEAQVAGQKEIAEINARAEEARAFQARLDAWAERQAKVLGSGGSIDEFREADPMPQPPAGMNVSIGQQVQPTTPRQSMTKYQRGLIDTLADPEKRATAIPSVVAQIVSLARTNPEAAKALIAQSSLTPEEIASGMGSEEDARVLEQLWGDGRKFNYSTPWKSMKNFFGRAFEGGAGGADPLTKTPRWGVGKI